MDERDETIAALSKLIDSGNLDERDAELLKKLRGMVVGRDAAVEKITAFRAEFEKTCGLFAEANAAVRAADDYASGIDAGIADSIDKHLRAVDRLCHFGCGDGFGCEHHIAE